MPLKLLAPGTVYDDVTTYIIHPNTGYLTLILNPFVYGLYSKQVHGPMIYEVAEESLMQIQVQLSCRCSTTT